MGKVFRLTWELNLLLPCFSHSALYCTRAYMYCNRWPSIPQPWYSTTVESRVQFCRRSVDPPIFSHLCIIFQWLACMNNANFLFFASYRKINFSHPICFVKTCYILALCRARYFPGFPAKFLRIFCLLCTSFRQCFPLHIKYVSFADRKILSKKYWLFIVWKKGSEIGTFHHFISFLLEIICVNQQRES